jgi:cytochrome b561
MDKKFSIGFRVWHLLNMVAIFGLAFTGFARVSFLNKHDVAQKIVAGLADKGITLSEDIAVTIAKTIRAEVWEWHYLFAPLLGMAIALRIFLVITKRVDIPFTGLFTSTGIQEKVKYLIHSLICLVIVVMAVTGALYHYHDTLGIAKESIKWTKELHSTLFIPLMVLVALHIIGVIKHEISTGESIVSRMIHGK